MKCSRCQHENADTMKFCGACGARLVLLCPACGGPNAPTQNFCGECGERLARPGLPPTSPSPDAYTPAHLAERILTSKAALEGERKQVTVLFADLKGSMELLADRDAEEARHLVDPVLEHMMEGVHRYEGTVNQVMGDGIMALFGAPLAHEDHAVRACYAALRMQESVRRYGEGVFRTYGVPIRVRIGLNSGEVVVRSIGSDLRMDYTAVGQTTHLAARMEQIADPGTVRMTAHTLHLAEGFVQVRSLGATPVKGLGTPVEVFELVGASPVRSRLQASTVRGLTKFVGRDPEMVVLWGALEQARAGRGQVVAVVGEPGVGKSRLVWELTHSHRAQGWLVLEGSSVSYGRADPYRPVLDLLRHHFGIDAAADARAVRAKVIGHLLAMDETLRDATPALLGLLDALPEDSAFRTLDPRQRREATIEAIKRLILRESQSRPLIAVFEDLHWIDAETQAALDALVEGLPASRALLIVTYRPEYHHGWGGRSYYTHLRIDPLSGPSGEELLQTLLGDGEELAPLRKTLVERAQGNPFFLEEIVRALVETGMLVGERAAYRLRGVPEGLHVPATVHAVLAARIDRLPREDKELLQCAAVVGKDAPLPLLEAVAELPVHRLRPSLSRLVAAEFLHESSLFPDIQYSFRHALTHEVAYGGLLRERAKALHARALEALEGILGGRRLEQADALARHAVRAEAWDRAVDYLHEAGRRAYDRTALPEALDRYEHALALMPRLPAGPETLRRGVDLRADFHFPLVMAFQIQRLNDILREAETLARELGDPLRLGRVSHRLGFGAFFDGRFREAARHADEALRIATTLDDGELRIFAGYLQGATHFARGDFHRAAECFLLIVDGPDADLARRVIAMTGPAHVAGCGWLAWAFALVGDFGRARAWADRGVERAEAVGHFQAQAVTYWFRGAVAATQGEFAEAMPWLERGIDLARQRALPALLGLFNTVYGSVLAWSGRADEGISAIEQSQKAAESFGIKVMRSFGSLTLAEGLLLGGRLPDAGRAAAQAVELASASGERANEASALHVLGEVARLGEPPDLPRARDAQGRALAIATELGMRPLAGRCHLAIGRASRQAGDLEWARHHLEAAASVFHDLGMRFWMEAGS